MVGAFHKAEKRRPFSPGFNLPTLSVLKIELFCCADAEGLSPQVGNFRLICLMFFVLVGWFVLLLLTGQDICKSGNTERPHLLLFSH